MPFFRTVGQVPHKRHTQFRKPDGGLYREEGMGRDGFVSDSALLYHTYPPTDVVSVDVWELEDGGSRPNQPLKPRLLQTHKIDEGGDAVTGRKLLLSSQETRLSYVAADRPSPLYRNAVGDEMYFVESGTARIETVFGVLDVGPRDFVVIPVSTTQRVVPTGDEPTRLLIVESVGAIRPPKRYLSERGQFLEHSPYCERDLRYPTEPHLEEGDNVAVYVRHRGGGTRFTYAHHPFDVVGWDGCMYPYVFNMDDFEPIIGRIPQPPTTFQVFEGPGVMICAVVPHKSEYHPEAVIVPADHANVDCDELMFYLEASFAGRDGNGLGQGAITFHPAGCVHGSRPGELERAVAAYNAGAIDMKEIRAVMIDTFSPLNLGDAGLASEDANYLANWHYN